MLSNRWPVSARSFLSPALLTVILISFVPPAFAGCTWKFDWYCSDCGKIGGRTTGSQGGYASEAACDNARDQVDSHVTTMSCDRVGTCDEPRQSVPEQEGNQTYGGGNTRATSPQRYDGGAQRRQEEQARRDEEQRKRREKQRHQAFEKSKQEALSLLKGGDTSSSNSGGSMLQLKSGTATFGIKGNPSGQLQLKSPEPVRVKKARRMTVDPSFFTRPKARLHIRDVPNPMQAPKGTWLRYVKSDRASLILDALEEGKGDLDRAIDYLDAQITLHGSNRRSSSALSYLEGLRTSYIAAGAEYRRHSKGNGQPVSVESKALLRAVQAASGMRKWPGPKNPNPGAKSLNPDDWRVKRANKMLAVLKASPGDLKKTYKMLRASKDMIAAANAEYYLRGAFAYWDFLAKQGGKK